jgi:hypothetical protein
MAAALLEARAAELRAFAQLAQSAAVTGRVPELSDVPQQVLITGGCATALFALALLPRGRRLLSDTVDTFLATALLILLVGVLLSLPFGEHPGRRSR